MSSAVWASATQGATTTSSRNKALADLRAAATAYDDSSATYDQIDVYYDGYNPTGQTGDQETGASWSQPDAATASWAKESE